MTSQEDLILRSPRGGRLEGRSASQPVAAAAESGASKRVCVGVVAGAHGVRGAVRIKSFTAEPSDVARYGKLSDEAGRREFSPRLIGLAKGVVLVKFADV